MFLAKDAKEYKKISIHLLLITFALFAPLREIKTGAINLKNLRTCIIRQKIRKRYIICLHIEF
jgi:hypothetical protein